MFNLQPVEKRVNEGSDLDVVDIWPTIQGEGPFMGCPATFIRLAGCNLNCAWCDTDYTSSRVMMSPDLILNSVSKHARLVVITGGEPLRQPIGSLTSLLLKWGFKVQIETNGTVHRVEMPFAHPRFKIVCSPKTAKIHPGLEPFISAWKYILDYRSVGTDGLPDSSLGCGVKVARPPEDHRGEIFVQPLDEGHEGENRKHMQACVASCLKFNYRLCIQLHKLAGLK